VRNGENEYLVRIDEMVVQRERKSPNPDASKMIAEDRPATGFSHDPFNRAIDLIAKVSAETTASPLVPNARRSKFLGRESVEADNDGRHWRSLLLVS
jgi:hypothetical protein